MIDQFWGPTVLLVADCLYCQKQLVPFEDASQHTLHLHHGLVKKEDKVEYFRTQTCYCTNNIFSIIPAPMFFIVYPIKKNYIKFMREKWILTPQYSLLMAAQEVPNTNCSII